MAGKIRMTAGVLALAMSLCAMHALAQTQTRIGSFAVVGHEFVRNGQPHVIRSGDIHYARVPRADWRDRLRKARAMGLNTIQTYVFWNLHEPAPGKFDFSGNLDVAAFVRMAQEEGLDVIVRPGPYICTELDFGGFPAWLLRTPGLRVRSLDPRFMRASAAYLQRVGQELAPLQISHGGPIVLVQVENEYGSFGRDHDYLQAIHAQYVAAGFDVPMFTSDGAGPRYFEGGTLPELTAVANFGGGRQDAADAYDALAAFRPDGPRMAGEYWAGWFDHWGETHHVTNAAEEAEAVDWMLAHRMSFNLYMWHGGTNFDWMPGANYSRTVPYQPDTTSYDYDAALDEAGRPTKKYFALREAIAKHLSPGERLPDVPNSAPTIAIPEFALTESQSLLDALPSLSTPKTDVYTRSMEELGQNYGFVLYRRTMPTAAKGRLSVNEVRDYATVLVDGATVGTLDRRTSTHALDVDLRAGATLDLLVENMGRINFGNALVDERKGISRSVSLGDDELTGWTMYPLPLDDLSRLRFSTRAAAPGTPAFWRGSFTLKTPGNTFLDTRGLGKGHVWVNGHHLGRYWNIGPQQSLYLPGAWLHRGRNEVVVLDVQDAGTRRLRGTTDPLFSTATPAP